MSRTDDVVLELDDAFARALPELVRPWSADPAPDPSLLVLNEQLAAELGLDADLLRSPAGVDLLVGNAAPTGVTTVAMAYAGHQFGSFNPGLGDGRALLLGELVDDRGHRRDLHLKGSGPTPFARGGDGRAALGPMLREHLVGEAMHALGIPTTRALAVTTTGMRIARDRLVPGAVLARVASSHLRVGTFQYASMRSNEVLTRLADHAIARHVPEASQAEQPYAALLDHVVEVQARLVAGWMLVGFVHGVLNTDNTTISGESIDYGPCAFMEAHDPATVFSSIDHGGRYAFGKQPGIVQWNLSRFAESILPLLADDQDAAVELATATLQEFAPRYRRHITTGLRRKLGLVDERDGDDAVLQGVLDLVGERRADHTMWFRRLADEVVSPTGDVDDPRLDAWRRRVDDEGRDPREVAAAMNAVNPLYIPRNHLVEEALSAATDGDLDPYQRLLEVVTQPFTERPGLERFVEPAPADAGPYVTYCGT